jgi:hypothetical protein
MFNAIESPVDEPSGRTRRWPSLGRSFYWSYLLGIPLAAIGGGAAMLIASNQLDAAVQTYRNAGPCPSPATSIACYTLVPGTLTKFSVSHGKSGDTTEMTLQLRDGIRSTWAKTNWQQEDALHVGAPVQAKFYKGALTAVYLGTSIGIQTKDNPIYKQTDLRKAAVVIPILGLVIAVVSFMTLRTRKALKLGPIPTIDPTLPIAEQERLLRNALVGVQPAETPTVTAGSQAAGVTLPFTLRPHPIPTGRPWWVGLIIAGIAVPLLLLRVRTPGSTAQVVLAATVSAMLAAVVLHWLYRNRRMLVVDDFTVRRMNLFGFSRVVPRTDIARLASPNVMSFGLPAPEQRLLLLDAGGRCLLGLRRYYSTDEEAVQLAAALRVPIDNKLAGSLTTPSRLRRTIPGAVSWSEAHPFLTTIVLIPPILVAVGLFVWMLNGFK